MEKSRSTTSSSVSAELQYSLLWKYELIATFEVVGQDELDTRSVNVRNRADVGTKTRGETIALDTICSQLVALKNSRSLENKLV